MKQASGLKASHAEMRNTNLSLILNLLLQEHILSRADLSKRTGLTRASVSSLVDELLTLGYIREIGTTDDGLIGKPAVLLELHTEKIFAVAVLLQDDSLTVAKVDLTGQLSCVMKKPLRTIKPVPVTRLMNEMLHTMLRGMEERGQKLAGIGLSVPSPILDRKLVYSYLLSRWRISISMMSSRASSAVPSSSKTTRMPGPWPRTGSVLPRARRASTI